MSQNLSDMLAKALEEVAADPVNGLSFATRKAILLELGPVASEATINAGLTRRTRLCVECVKRVLKIWDAHYPTKQPQRMVELAEGYLQGGFSAKQVDKEALSFRGGLDSSDTPDKQPAYLVGRGAVCAALVATTDELLEPDEGISLEELMAPEDPNYWDCAYWVAGAEAGGMPWEEAFDRAKYRAFWDWYLIDAIPRAWSAVQAR
jgi:Immunity protein Imm5